MAETKRLGPWGWFVRAFAAGFGWTFGVVVASVLAIAGCYALIAAGVLAFSSLGGIELNSANTPSPVTLNSPPTSASTYPTHVQPAPYVGGSYGASSSGGAGGYAAPSPTYYPASPAIATTGEVVEEIPPADAQLAPPVITIPSEPTPAPEAGTSVPLE